MALIANNFVVGKQPEPVQQPSQQINGITASNIVIVNKPKPEVKPQVVPVIPVKPIQQPRKSAYHSDMTTVHKL